MPRAMTEQVEVRIESIGARGDGVARLDGEKLFVPYSAPGDVVRVAKPGRSGGQPRCSIIELVRPGPDRAQPVCGHFGVCGGCALQHLKPEVHRGWKRSLVREALGHRGLGDVEVADPVVVAPGSRRRATLRFRKTGADAVLGFNAARSDRIVPIDACPVTVAPIVALLAPLRQLLVAVIPAGEVAVITMTSTTTGIDLVIEARVHPDIAIRERIAAFAEAGDLARVSWRHGIGAGAEAEAIVERRRPVIQFGEIAISPPAGAFLQPTKEGEDAMRRMLLAALGDGSRRILDLFSGCGTFALPLARGRAVHAVDADALMLGALVAASRDAAGLKAVTVEQRDLFRTPVRAAELDRYDIVIMDPPRAGARAQANEIAASKVPIVAAISCNPATFARDARTLIDGGYRLGKVTPIDQCPWSAHVELVGIFKRG